MEGSRQVNRNIDFYNLDAIISVGYRVNSVRATQFRQWATKVLHQFAIKGFVIDKERMENGTFLVKTILNTYYRKFGRYVSPNVVSIRKLPIYTQLVLITIEVHPLPVISLPKFRTSFILLYTVIRQLN